MADEIVLNISARLQSGYLLDQFSPGQILLDQDTPNCGGYTQSITTSEEDVDFGDIPALTDGAVVIFRNLDTTNYIDLGPSDGGTGGTMLASDRLYPGMVAVHCIGPTTVFRAQANTAACSLYVRVYPFDWNPGT